MDGAHDSVATRLAQFSDKWRHIVMVYQPGIGLQVYGDGYSLMDTAAWNGDHVTDPGNLVIGRAMESYSGVTVDELMFFNRPLTGLEVKALRNSYSNAP